MIATELASRLSHLLRSYCVKSTQQNIEMTRIQTYRSKLLDDYSPVSILVKKLICTTGTLLPVVKCLQLMDAHSSCTKFFKIHSSVLKCIQLSCKENNEIGKNTNQKPKNIQILEQPTKTLRNLVPTDDKKSGIRESFIASVAFFIKACNEQKECKTLIIQSSHLKNACACDLFPHVCM